MDIPLSWPITFALRCHFTCFRAQHNGMFQANSSIRFVAELRSDDCTAWTNDSVPRRRGFASFTIDLVQIRRRFVYIFISRWAEQGSHLTLVRGVGDFQYASLSLLLREEEIGFSFCLNALPPWPQSLFPLTHTLASREIEEALPFVE